MSISTLKTAKVGATVTMLAFTGMNIGQFKISKAGKTKVAIECKGGVKEFSRETGIQTNANNPKYANKIVDPIPEREKGAKPAKKAAKKAEVEEAPEEKGEKKASKAKAEKPAKKAPAKKVEKVEIPDDAEDFDDDDFDDDFEEFDEE